MTKTILLTGATDGIGLETAKRLAPLGHTLLLHGRNADKLTTIADELSQSADAARIAVYQADLSRLDQVTAMAEAIRAQHDHIDVLINNAGVYKTANELTAEGQDVRFIVNTIAPYVLTQALLPAVPSSGRIVNLSSAAQAPVDMAAFMGQKRLSASAAYAQSKLAITMWSMHLAAALAPDGPTVVAVNPASLLGSKMVKEAYGTEGKDIGIGADILVRSALSDEFEGVTGRYYDNDHGQFAEPHADALSAEKNQALVKTMESVIDRLAS